MKEGGYSMEEEGLDLLGPTITQEGTQSHNHKVTHAHRQTPSTCFFLHSRSTEKGATKQSLFSSVTEFCILLTQAELLYVKLAPSLSKIHQQSGLSCPGCLWNTSVSVSCTEAGLDKVEVSTEWCISV